MAVSYSQILSRRYSNFDYRTVGPLYDDIIWVDSARKPTQAELDALAESVESEIALEQALNLRISAMQSKYTLQEQIIEIFRAITLGDTEKVEEMLGYWEVL